MYDYYIIHSRSLSDFAITRTEILEDLGYSCYLPCRDLDDSGKLPLEIHKECDNAIANSRKVVLIWDSVSYGAYGDLRVAMALGVPIENITRVGDKGGPYALVNQLEAEVRQKRGG